MNTLLSEGPVWLAADPIVNEEKADDVEDSIYHRPVLENEVVKQLAPKAGSRVVDGTCGGRSFSSAYTARCPRP